MQLLKAVFGRVTAAKIQHIREQFQRGIVMGGVLAICALIALCGLGFIAAGVYVSLRETFLPWQAGLIVGGGALVLALIGALLARLVLAERKPATAGEVPGQARPDEQDRVESVAELGRALGAGLARSRLNTTDVMLGALLAGALLGAVPGLREGLHRRRRCAPDAAARRRPQGRTRRS